MRPLDHVDPRRVALLLVPVLLLAGAAQGLWTASPVVAVRAVVPSLPLPALGLAAARPDAEAVGPATPRRQDRAARRGDGPAAISLSSSTSSSSSREPSAEQRGRDALHALAYDPAALGYRVRFVAARSGALGSTNRDVRLITLRVRPGQSELVLRTTIAHELGHALDFAHGTPERRDAYRRLRQLPAGPWYPCDRCSDFASPAGDFAEVFALWLAGPGDFRSRLAGPPTAAQLRELAPLFEVPVPTPRPAGASPAPSPTPTGGPPRGLPDVLDPRPTRAPARA